MEYEEAAYILEFNHSIDNIIDKTLYHKTDEWRGFLTWRDTEFKMLESIEYLKQLNLVTNKEGLISMTASLELCDNPRVVAMVKIIALMNDKRIFLRGTKKNSPKKLKWNKLVPILPSMWKVAANIPYSYWSTAGADSAILAFGSEIYTGMGYINYFRNHPDMLMKVRDASKSYKNLIEEDDLQMGSILKLPNDGVSGKKMPTIPNMVLQQLGFASPDFRTELMITNYEDLDTYPEAL